MFLDKTGSPITEEDPPYCYGWFDADDANENAYFQSNDSFDARHLHYLINSSSSQPVCALDPFEATSIHYVNASVMVMDIHCSEPGTRIVMKLGSKNISSPLVWLLWVTNCSIYWKDISKLGKHIVIVSMLFVDWQDEFMTGEPEYFNACVHLKQRDGEYRTQLHELLVRCLRQICGRHWWGLNWTGNYWVSRTLKIQTKGQILKRLWVYLKLFFSYLVLEKMTLH